MLPKNLVLNYTIRFSDEGWKRYKKLDSRVRKKVTEKIELLGDYRSLNTVKKMEGKDKDYFRLRVGSVRVLFRVIQEDKTIWITDMGFRGSVYRD